MFDESHDMRQPAREADRLLVSFVSWSSHPSEVCDREGRTAADDRVVEARGALGVDSAVVDHRDRVGAARYRRKRRLTGGDGVAAGRCGAGGPDIVAVVGLVTAVMV